MDMAADPRHGITKLTVYIPDSGSNGGNSGSHGNNAKNGSDLNQPKPPRWNTLEFKFYGFVFAVMIPIMIWIPMSVSQTTHPNYPLFAHRLSPGWIPSRRIDNSDNQYRKFRSHLPSLIFLASLHLAASTLHSHWLAPRWPRFGRLSFTCGFSLLLVIVLHGANALKILVILAGNYLVTSLALAIRRHPHPTVQRTGPLLIWAYNIAILFANDYYQGYPFHSLASWLSPLDNYQGLLPRWHIGFNVTTLRLISFAMDKYWAVAETSQQSPSTPATTTIEKPLTDSMSFRTRVKTSHHPTSVAYTLTSLITYTLYPPLYIAGPIITFNDFYSQLVIHPLVIPKRTITAYAFRFMVCLLTMELVLHFIWVVAIKDTGAWAGCSPAQLSMIGFWNLAIVWLKLLVPWRFFRLWSLMDTIDPPENMIRCMANNYSCAGFWRSWHRSYNLWIVRYIYVPLGGNRHVILSTLLVFTFVALWHDLSFRLLTWGWLVSLFILPEIIAKSVVRQDRYGDRPWYRHVAASGAVLNILFMMTCNLVGFVIGVDGVKYLFQQLMGSYTGWSTLIFSCLILFVGVQAMFEYREEEIRQGIVRKC